MVPDLLLLTAAVATLSLMPVLSRQTIALPRIVAAGYGGTVALIALLWLGWVLFPWIEPRW